MEPLVQSRVLHPAGASIEGGDLLVQALERRGVRCIFSVSGGPINSIYHATSRSSIRLIHVRHEAAAAFMADATARVTGTPGVALVTLGPGVTNTVTGAATSLLAGVPVLIVGGQTATRNFDRGAGMSLDTLTVMRSATKWSAQVLDTSRIPEYVEEAWHRMTSGRPGPVYLEIPVDVLSGPADGGLQDHPIRRHPPGADAEAVRSACEALAAAHRPLLLAGDDTFFGRAGEALRQFVEEQETPFALLRLARGTIDERHPLSIGPGYTPANPVLRRALAEADCIMLLGHYWEFDLDFGALCGPQATLLQVYPDGAFLGRNRPVHVAVEATARSFLQAAAGAPKGDRDKAWVRSVAGAWRAYREGLSREAASATLESMHPVRLVDEVVTSAPDDAIYVTSHGNIDFWVDAYLQLTRPGHYLRAGQSGALGAEIPFGVAAKLACPDQPVVVFVGDGGFGYHCLELETAARYAAPVVVIVADDGKWGAIAHPQRRRYGVEVEMGLPRRDWARMVEAIGGYGETVERAGEVGPVLLRALKSGRPSVVHVRVASIESPYIRYTSG